MHHAGSNVVLGAHTLAQYALPDTNFIEFSIFNFPFQVSVLYLCQT
jgi:hypothetical protein